MVSPPDPLIQIKKVHTSFLIKPCTKFAQMVPLQRKFVLMVLVTSKPIYNINLYVFFLYQSWRAVDLGSWYVALVV